MNGLSVFSDIVYRQTPQRPLRLDLYIPEGGAEPPLVLYIPVRGMRDSPKERAPRWLTEHGFALASIECRGSSEATAPAQVYDCKAAVRWLRFHAEAYGFNPDAIGAWGHSAGGLLAALMATSGDVPDLAGDGDHGEVSTKIQAACDECGAPHDLSYFARPEVQAEFPVVTENLRLYLGGAVQEKSELARRVSPRTYVSPNCPPMLLIHGDEDNIVPVEETIEFHKCLVAAGVDATLKVVTGAGHSWDKEFTREDIKVFFQRTLDPVSAG